MSPFLPGPTASCSEGAFRARRLCLAFLQQRLSRMTTLDQEILEALRVYDCSLSREPQWGEDFFGIDPFYIALGIPVSVPSPATFEGKELSWGVSGVSWVQGLRQRAAACRTTRWRRAPRP